MVPVFPSSFCSLTTSFPAEHSRPETVLTCVLPRSSVPPRPADLQEDRMTLAVTLSRKQTLRRRWTARVSLS
ncbi:hypothetical protein MHYP_G00243430 [Metynnis hypsauchen]